MNAPRSSFYQPLAISLLQTLSRQRASSVARPPPRDSLGRRLQKACHCLAPRAHMIIFPLSVSFLGFSVILFASQTSIGRRRNSSPLSVSYKRRAAGYGVVNRDDVDEVQNMMAVSGRKSTGLICKQSSRKTRTSTGPARRAGVANS